MTEQEWLACNEPSEMLWFLHGKLSERQQRLFAVACCRRIWHLLPDKRSRCAVEVAERHIDGRATDEELEKSSDAAYEVWDADMERASTEGTWNKRSDLPFYCGSAAACNVAIPMGWWGGAPAFVAPDEMIREILAGSGEEEAQCVLLRDIIGNPFMAISFDSRWLTPTIEFIAEQIYETRAFERMTILGDGLEEAGCKVEEGLGHCRGEQPHCRGCWVIDQILGRE